MLVAFEFLEEDHILTGHEEGRGQEVVLVGLGAVALLVQRPFELLEVFAEHILAAEFGPAAEVVDFGALLESVLLENPVDLFLLAPHHVPVVGIGLAPLAVVEAFVDAVAEGGFEFDVLVEWAGGYGGVG